MNEPTPAAGEPGEHGEEGGGAGGAGPLGVPMSIQVTPDEKAAIERVSPGLGEFRDFFNFLCYSDDYCYVL